MRSAKHLSRFQGLYFFGTGIWPLVHIDSFLFVTGPKTDLWLVDTVAVLVIAIGAGLLVATHNPLPATSTIAIAMGSSAGLLYIDVKYVLLGTISPVYLADAVAQAFILGWWIFLLASWPKSTN